MNIVFEEIDIKNRRQRNEFIALPFSLARHHERWQPGLKLFIDQLVHPRSNPFWSEVRASFFVVRRNGVIVGRIGLLAPGYIQEHPDAAVFMFPDFVQEKEVFDLLIREVIVRAGGIGAHKVIGPLNPNIHYDVGIQFTGFDQRNYLFMGYQPEYYHHWFEEAGFVKVTDFYGWELQRESYARQELIRSVSNRVKKNPGLSIREVTHKSFDQDLELFFRLYCDCFSTHWGFRSPSWAEFRFIAGDIKLIFRQGMILIAEWNSQPVGFVLGVPDLFELLGSRKSGKLDPGLVWRLLARRKDIKRVRVMIAGVLPEFRSKSIHIPLFTTIADNIFRLGYSGGEISWVMEGNEGMEKILPLMGAVRKKGYRLYRLDL